MTIVCAECRCEVVRAGKTSCVPGTSRPGSSTAGLAARSSSHRVPRPRCWRDRFQSVSPGWTTIRVGVAFDARESDAENDFGCGVTRGSTGRIVIIVGGAGCVRRPTNGSMRRTRDDGKEGALGTAECESGATGRVLMKFFGRGCSRELELGSTNGATIFGAASVGSFVGKWKGEIFLALR